MNIGFIGFYLMLEVLFKKSDEHDKLDVVEFDAKLLKRVCFSRVFFRLYSRLVLLQRRRLFRLPIHYDIAAADFRFHDHRQILHVPIHLFGSANIRICAQQNVDFAR